MHMLLDTITLVMAVVALFLYSDWAFRRFNCYTALGLTITILYLFAQTGWTVAFLSGDVWGREFNNYIWFTFNTSVFLLLTLIWYRRN